MADGMKLRRCGRITYAPTSAPCDCYEAVHQCNRKEGHWGEHRCTCEHQWDERADAPSFAKGSGDG